MNNQETNEFDKLVTMMNEAKIPYERQDSIWESGRGIRRIKYPSVDNFVCSAICGFGTYGYERGEIEIMGLLTPEEEAIDSVTGYLTANDVFNRIKKHWETYKKVVKNE